MTVVRLERKSGRVDHFHPKVPGFRLAAKYWSCAMHYLELYPPGALPGGPPPLSKSDGSPNHQPGPPQYKNVPDEPDRREDPSINCDCTAVQLNASRKLPKPAIGSHIGSPGSAGAASRPAFALSLPPATPASFACRYRTSPLAR
jgi:hypothetical protein